MEHHFDIEIAEDVGVSAAIIYYNIKYWCEKNKANDVNYHDGYYWTFNSVKAFQKLFPYLSDKKISSSLKILEDREYIKSGNYNDSTYDRTKWYADIRTNMGDSNLHNGVCHLPKKENGDTQNGEPIPNINTNIKPNNKLIEKEIYKEREVVEKPKKEKFDAFKEFSSIEEIKNDPELLQTFKEFVDMRNEIKKPIKTMRGVNGILNECRRLSNGNHKLMIEIIKQSIDHEWCGVFEVKRQQSVSKSTGNPFGKMLENEGYNVEDIVYGKSGDFNFT
jgi:hypothetical protein